MATLLGTPVQSNAVVFKLFHVNDPPKLTQIRPRAPFDKILSQGLLPDKILDVLLQKVCETHAQNSHTFCPCVT